MKPYKTLSRWASTSNAEKLVKIARIVYQLCDYTDFRAVFLKTKQKMGEVVCFCKSDHIFCTCMCQVPIAMVMSQWVGLIGVASELLVIHILLSPNSWLYYLCLLS